MDIVEATNDLQDWELLHTSSDSGWEPVSPPDHVSSLEEMDSGGLIQTNYFSLESESRYEDHHVHDGDSSCEQSEDGICRDLVEEKVVRIEGSERKGEEAEDLGDSCMTAEISDLGEKCEVGVEVDMNENEGIGVVEGKKSSELEKMPMEFLKHCMIRMSPVWTVSVAAAVLGRRWYQTKRRSRGLEIKVAVDDKKAYQVMSRLNEAFSAVKQVPFTACGWVEQHNENVKCDDTINAAPLLYQILHQK